MSTSKPPIENSAKAAQADKFRDLARELECDEDEDAFKAKLRQIAKTPPQHREKPPENR
jgi:hypothetical protein